MGAVVAMFVLLLASTGILLNHTSDFKLDQYHLTWPWLLKHYGMDTVEVDEAYLLGDKVITQVNEQIFIGGKPVVESYKTLIGGIVLDDITVLATADELILLSPNDEFIEKLSASVGIPPQIQNIGLHHGLPILQTRQGMWRGDYILEDWQNISLQGVSWSRPVPAPEQAQQQLARYFHGQGITVERFVLDLHNGRILSAVGIWLLDILAVLLIVLSLSGLWIWTRTRY
jgi:hypothetical protein